MMALHVVDRKLGQGMTYIPGEIEKHGTGVNVGVLARSAAAKREPFSAASNEDSKPSAAVCRRGEPYPLPLLTGSGFPRSHLLRVSESRAVAFWWPIIKGIAWAALIFGVAVVVLGGLVDSLGDRLALQRVR